MVLPAPGAGICTHASWAWASSSLLMEARTPLPKAEIALVALYFFGCPESSVFTTLAKEDISAIDLNTPLHTRETPSHVRVQPPEAASARSAGSEQG